MCVGLAIYPIGKVGQFFAALIVSAVNRQREFLADAHAVELTRNPHGLREALELIEEEGAANVSSAGDEASHLFFVEIHAFNGRFFATHPPLHERIARLANDAPPPPSTTRRFSTGGASSESVLEEVTA